MSSAAPQHDSCLTRRDRILLALALIILQTCGAWRVSLFDRDEGWYACITREMLATGDYLVPRYLGESAYFKPPWMYWCAAASVRLFGEGELALRLPGILASAAAWLLTADWAARLWGRAAGYWTAAMGGALALPHVAGTLLLADGHLLLFTVAAMRCWLTPPHRSGDKAASWFSTKGRSALFWTALGFGLLAKGPAILVVLGMVAAARTVWDQSPTSDPAAATGGSNSNPDARRLSRLRRLWPGPGWHLTLLIAAPWYAAVLWRDGDAFLRGFVGRNALDVATKATFGHSGPPGYHLALLPLTAWPWAALLPAAIYSAWKLRREQIEVSWLLTWLIAPWPVFELLGTKLPHYVLPLFPPLAMLVARNLALGHVSATPRVDRLNRILLVTAFAAAAAAAGVGGVWLWSSARQTSAAPGLLLAAGLLLSATLAAIRVRPAIRSVPWGLGAVIGAQVLVGWWVLPALEPLRLSRQVARAARELARPGEPILAHAFDEPTMFYYLPRGATTLSRAREAGLLRHAASAVLIVRSTRAAEIAADWSLEASQTLSGFNYAAGRTEAVTVGRAQPRAAPGLAP